MKWIRFCGAFVVIVGLTTTAQAGVFKNFSLFGKGDSKCCGSTSSCQPKCCKPVIKRPCQFSCHTFQRKVCTKARPCCKPKCCDSECSPRNCCKKISIRFGFGKSCCKTTNDCCTSTKKNCCKKTNNCCTTKKSCCKTGNDCCGKRKWFNFRLFKRSRCCTSKPCCTTKKPCCPTKPSTCCKNDPCGKKNCGNCGQKCCNADPCEIAELIYDSQTACYAKDRRKAIGRLGRFDCQCNPEIMVAFVYALNDADEIVRAEAADEIGDQLRNNPCCCSKELTAALTVSLADCDRDVRRQAEQALEACGYEVVKGCCDSCGKCCKDSCNKSCCKRSRCNDPCCTDHGKASPTPTPRKKTDKAPPAPGKGDIYFNTPVPSRNRFTPEWESTSSQRIHRNRRLSNLFGLLK